MTPIALVARPRFWLASALLGIALFGRPSPGPSALPHRCWPRQTIVIELQPHSDLAILGPEVNDPMNAGVGPLASWISHLLQKLAGDAA